LTRSCESTTATDRNAYILRLETSPLILPASPAWKPSRTRYLIPVRSLKGIEDGVKLSPFRGGSTSGSSPSPALHSLRQRDLRAASYARSFTVHLSYADSARQSQQTTAPTWSSCTSRCLRQCDEVGSDTPRLSDSKWPATSRGRITESEHRIDNGGWCFQRGR
jgi:hypothetical protein